MQPKVIITCAVTGAGDTVGKHPAIPVTPEQIAQERADAKQLTQDMQKINPEQIR